LARALARDRGERIEGLVALADAPQGRFHHLPGGGLPRRDGLRDLGC
jgi:hypothetical protein